MGRRKRGLTMERHREIGKRAYEICEELVHLSVEVGNAYPINGPQFREINKTIRALREFRTDMENRMFEDCPDEAAIRVYWPGPTQ